MLVMEDIESKNIKHPSRTPTLSLDFEGKQLQVRDVDWLLFLGAMFDSDSGNLSYQLEKQGCVFLAGADADLDFRISFQLWLPTLLPRPQVVTRAQLAAPKTLSTPRISTTVVDAWGNRAYLPLGTLQRVAL